MTDLTDNVTLQIALAIQGGSCAFDCPDEICDCGYSDNFKRQALDMARMQAEVIIDMVRDSVNRGYLEEYDSISNAEYALDETDGWSVE